MSNLVAYFKLFLCLFLINRKPKQTVLFLTNSPASLLVNFPLVSFGVRYFYQLRGVSVPPLSVCVPASLLLSAFSLQINQTTKYFCINEARGCWKNRSFL